MGKRVDDDDDGDGGLDGGEVGAGRKGGGEMDGRGEWDGMGGVEEKLSFPNSSLIFRG